MVCQAQLKQSATLRFCGQKEQKGSVDTLYRYALQRPLLVTGLTGLHISPAEGTCWVAFGAGQVTPEPPE